MEPRFSGTSGGTAWTPCWVRQSRKGARAVLGTVAPLGSVMVGDSLVVAVDLVPVEAVVGDETVGTVIVLPATVVVTDALSPSPPPQPEASPIRPATTTASAALSPCCIPPNTKALASRTGYGRRTAQGTDDPAVHRSDRLPDQLERGL